MHSKNTIPAQRGYLIIKFNESSKYKGLVFYERKICTCVEFMRWAQLRIADTHGYELWEI